MKSFSLVAILTMALAAYALPQDAAGSQNVGKGNGAQFITGQCLSDADCASACCAGPKGVCSAKLAANDAGKTGCGFVSGTGASSNASTAAAAAAATTASTCDV